MTIILGLNVSHDATAVIMDIEGNVLAGIAEERITRKKYHETFPYRAIMSCLRVADLAPEDITHVAYNWNCLGSSTYREEIFNPENTNIDWANKIPLSIARKTVLEKFFSKIRNSPEIEDIEFVKKALNYLGISTNHVRSFEHQSCHAASAFFSSPFDDALVVSLDGYGDGKAGGVYIGKSRSLECIETIDPEVSVGSFYANITGALGFKRNRHEGKITGLAAYGDAQKCQESLAQFLDLDSKDFNFIRPYKVKPSLFSKLWSNLIYFMSGKYSNFYFDGIKSCIAKGGFNRKDVSAASQLILEKTATKYIEHRCKESGLRKVALAGGVFANVKLNQCILELDCVDELFVHPNMGDGGGAFGAAVLNLIELNKRYHHKPIKDVFWGPEFSDEEIELSLKASGLNYTRPKNIEKETAELLAEGKVVGRFNGRMEYGPRALCNRSILVQPTNRDLNDSLNKRLNRTEFMPFAPVVLESHANEIFEGFKESRLPCKFMTITTKVKEEWINRIAAVVHIDDTARPQWVSHEYNPSCAKILNYYYEKTGLPVLVNTSFNKHEEPIVCDPKEAIHAFQTNAIDALSIGSFLIEH